MTGDGVNDLPAMRESGLLRCNGKRQRRRKADGTAGAFGFGFFSLKEEAISEGQESYKQSDKIGRRVLYKDDLFGFTLHLVFAFEYGFSVYTGFRLH